MLLTVWSAGAFFFCLLILNLIPLLLDMLRNDLFHPIALSILGGPPPPPPPSPPPPAQWQPWSLPAGSRPTRTCGEGGGASPGEVTF